MPLITEIPYQTDSSLLFNAIADEPWAIFLDSAQTGIDIMASRPFCCLVTKGNETTIIENDQQKISKKPALSLVREYLGKKQPSIPNIPFCGGAMGWFGYDLAKQLEKWSDLTQDKDKVADMAIAFYDWSLVINHKTQRSQLVSQQIHAQTQQIWQALIALFHQPKPYQGAPFQVLQPIQAEISKAEYIQNFNRIKSYIKEGDCYQINYSQRFTTQAKGSAWLAYQALRQISPAPFSAFIHTPQGTVLSTSPERFLSLHYGIIETKPIKGTLPRNKNSQQDQDNAQKLAHSPKDRAENLMIVDLLRHDLGRCCKIGTVHVPILFAIESFSNVHHLVSTVRGLLAKNKDAIDVLEACFPGGSITGAPKIRAMQIIEELEQTRRGIYCGSIGYIGFDGQMELNIAIRTLLYKEDNISFNVGGGIVYDSNAKAEYQETLDKASGLITFLETHFNTK